MKNKIIEGFKVITGVRYRELKAEWADQNILIDKLMVEKKEYKDEIKKLKKKHEEKVEELKKMCDGFTSGIAKKDKDLFISTSIIEELREQVDTLKGELSRNDDELIEARVTIESLKNEIARRDATIADLETCLEQANSTDNVQPDCAEDERPDGLIFSSDELCVSDIEIIPGKVNLNPEDLNLTYSKIDEGLGSFVVRTSEKAEEAPKKKGRPKKTTTKKTPKKSDIKKK